MGRGRRQRSRRGYCWAGLHLCAASIRDLIPHLVRLLLKSLAARAFTLHCALAAPPHPALRASWTIFRRCAMQGLFQGSAAGIAASPPPPAASAASRPLLQPWRLAAAPRPTAACACRCTSPGRRCWCMESSASRAGAGPLPTAGGCGLPPLCSSRPRSRSRWGRRPCERLRACPVRGGAPPHCRPPHRSSRHSTAACTLPMRAPPPASALTWCSRPPTPPACCWAAWRLWMF